MADWPVLTVTTILNVMPTDLKNMYASWIEGNADKVDRLSELVTESVAIFREVVDESLRDEDETTVPITGYRHAINMIIFNLGMEMGVEFASEVFSLFSQANTWLRMTERGGLGGAVAIVGTPSYTQPTADFTGPIRDLGRWI